jgi:hypothetical protein
MHNGYRDLTVNPRLWGLGFFTLYAIKDCGVRFNYVESEKRL